MTADTQKPCPLQTCRHTRLCIYPSTCTSVLPDGVIRRVPSDYYDDSSVPPCLHSRDSAAEREELCELLFGVVVAFAPVPTVEQFADAIIAAGYHK